MERPDRLTLGRTVAAALAATGNIARDIHDDHADYDGFVVVRGTDTMAYTSSVLAFILRDLGKPVVVTGSQIPFCGRRFTPCANADQNLY